MRNNLKDLNNLLFMQLEKLSDDDLKGEELKKELQRTSSIAQLSRDVIAIADLQLRAINMQNQYNLQDDDLTELTYNKKTIKNLREL